MQNGRRGCEAKWRKKAKASRVALCPIGASEMERDSSSGGRKNEGRGLVQFTSVSFYLARCFVVCFLFCLFLSLSPLTHSISDIVACLEFVYEKPLALGISKHIEREGER